jgi:WD40 repeat protein
VAQVSFSRDDAYLVSAAADNQVMVWSMASRASVATIPIADHPWTVEVSPLSTATTLPIAVTLFDGSLVLMNARAATPVLLTTLVSTDSSWLAEGLAYSPDGTSIAVGSEDGSLSFWSGASSGLRPVRTSPDFLPPNPNGNYQAVKGVAFFPDGQHVAAATGTSGNGGQLGVWETGTRRQVGTKIPTYYLLSVAVSPDGAGVAAGEVECGLVLYCRD